MLLKVLIIQQVIFRKIVEGGGQLLLVWSFAHRSKSFSVAGSDIRGDIDIEACFSGQMLWRFCFITVFSNRTRTFSSV